MTIYTTLNNGELICAIKNGEIGIVPTDTIYGISCSAFFEESVERIYAVKGRELNKPVIILISDITDLGMFEIKPNKEMKGILEANWPGPISFILPISEKFNYLSRGLPGLAFRCPANRELVKFLTKTGPLVSTSANISGEAAITNIDDALNVFEDTLDFYVDAGELISEPSTLVDLTSKSPKILRQGAKSCIIE